MVGNTAVRDDGAGGERLKRLDRDRGVARLGQREQHPLAADGRLELGRRALGGQRVLLTLAEAGDTAVAVKALQPFAAGSIVPNGSVSDHGGRLLEVPVLATDGLATEVLRALDAADVRVSDIAVRSASLDDVFLTLTGRAAEAADEDEEKAELAEEATV